MRQLGLFSGIEPKPNPGWRPPDLPSLDGIRDVYLDCETTGLRHWDGDRLIGVALGLPDGRDYYLGCGHSAGNIDPDLLRRYLQRELRGKYIRGLNIPFDAHNLFNFGVDLEAQGNTLSDIGHYAALLDDHRQKFSLEAISRHYVKEGKVQGLDVTKLKEYPAWEVEPYAKQDVRLLRLNKEVMWPLLHSEDLMRVVELENRVIYTVLEMERNAAPIDVPLLQHWVKASEQELLKLLWQIHGLTGIYLRSFSSVHLARLFDKLGINIVKLTEAGNPSFDDLVLKSINHPVVQMVRRAKKLASIRSKYLLRYAAETANGDLLRYALHQLKADYGEDEGQGGGCVTGRFSSSGHGTGIIPDGVNVQQVMTLEKTRQAFGFAADDDSHDEEIYATRELYIPRKGLWLAADAKQIEYRLFAHYSKSKKILQAYKDNPDTNFHKLIQGMIQRIRPDIPYRRTKDINFAKIYGAGLPKIALMMEMPIHEAESFVRDYDAMLPEVGILISEAIRTAETRGYVKTLLGRRSRFPYQERIHKALNSVIQGSAADIMKTKLVELHDARHETGFTLRFTVHDEVDGDIPDEQAVGKVAEILNRQTYDLRVPILWDVHAGRNWMEAKAA